MAVNSLMGTMHHDIEKNWKNNPYKNEGSLWLTANPQGKETKQSVSIIHLTEVQSQEAS